MRWALVKVCLAVTAMVVVAFAVPLGLVIKEMARDRAFSNAERTAAAIGPTLSITTDRDELTRAVASTEAGADGRMAVYIPAAGGAPAIQVGTSRAGDGHVGLRQATVADVPGGSVWLQPIAVSSGIAVVEVFVPESEVTNGVATAWLVLAGVGVALVIGSVAVADRLGVRMVQPAQRLVSAAHELGEGKLGARVPEEGPTELRLAAVAFNSMADQVVQLLANERELAADLSHRLRTPLTVLRLNAVSLGKAPPPTRPAPPSSSWSARSTPSSVPLATPSRRPPPRDPGPGATPPRSSASAWTSGPRSPRTRGARCASPGSTALYASLWSGGSWPPRSTRCSGMSSGTRPRAPPSPSTCTAARTP